MVCSIRGPFDLMRVFCSLFIVSCLHFRNNVARAASPCALPPGYAHVNASAGDCTDVPVGSSCAYACDAGFVASGTAECQGDEVYLLSGSGPACIQLCALGTAADSVPYATVDDATCSRGAGVPVQEGDSCNFTCTESGTVLVGGGNDAVGPATMTCSGGSLVHAGSLFCALPCVSDPAIDELDFNNSFCEGTAHNSTCSFQCAGNFTTAGNGTARCFDGSWIDSDYCAAQCDGTPASSLEHFAFDAANATQEAACRDAPHGTLCPFECGSTFVPVSRLLPGKTAPASVQCLDGEWQTADLRCEAPCLSTPNIPFSLLQEPDCNGTLSGGTCSFTCAAPFIPHGDAVCNNGRWIRDICGAVYELETGPQCPSNHTRHTPTFATCEYALERLGLFNDSVMTLEAVTFSTLPKGCYRFDATRFYFNELGVDDYVNEDGNNRQSICVDCGDFCNITTTTTTTTSTTTSTTTTTTTISCDGSWAAWGTCDVSCGGGNQSRTFDISQFPVGGAPCPAPEYRACSIDDCPVDCTGSWATWGSCSASCATPITATTSALGPFSGLPTRERAFVVAQSPQFGGAACPDDDAELCNTDPCPVDCDGEWGAWGECSGTCTVPDAWGGSENVKRRSFEANTSTAFGGVECPPDEEVVCATDPCTTTTTTTTTLQACADPTMLAAPAYDSLGALIAGPWPAVFHGEVSSINCSTTAGPVVGSFTGTISRVCVDGVLQNATTNCTPDACESVTDSLTYGGMDTDGVTPITLRGPWPAVASGNDAVIVCDLNAGVDDEEFGDYLGTVRRRCYAGSLGPVEGECVPRDCPAEYGDTDAQGLELAGFWPDTKHGHYSYMDCFSAAKFNLLRQLFQWQGNISRFCRAGKLFPSGDMCTPLQCSGEVLLGDNELGTAGGTDERGQQIKGPWPATDPLEYSEIDCASEAGIDYSYLPVDTGDFTGTLTRRCFDQRLEEVSGSCTSGPCKRTVGTTYDAYGTAIAGPWDRIGTEDITTWEETTLFCSSSSGAAMGLGHGSYSGNVTRQCFAGILMETEGICEPSFECDALCVIFTYVGLVLSLVMVLCLVLATASCCIEAGVVSKRQFSSLKATDTSSRSGIHSIQNEQAVPHEPKLEEGHHASERIADEETAQTESGQPDELELGALQVDLRHRHNHAVVVKQETTYGEENEVLGSSSAADNVDGNSEMPEERGEIDSDLASSVAATLTASSLPRIGHSIVAQLLDEPDTAPLLKNNRVAGQCCLCPCSKVARPFSEVCCSWGGSSKTNGMANVLVSAITLLLNMQLLSLVHLLDFVQNRAPLTYDVSYTLSLAALQVPMSTAWEVDPSTNVTAKSLALSENVALGIAISPQEAQARVVDTTLQRYLDVADEYPFYFEKMTAHHEEVECRYVVSEWEIGEVVSLFSTGSSSAIAFLFFTACLQLTLFHFAACLRRGANASIQDRLDDDERIKALREEAALQEKRDEEERLRQEAVDAEIARQKKVKLGMNSGNDSDSTTDSEEEFQARQQRIKLSSPKYRAELLRKKIVEDASKSALKDATSTSSPADDQDVDVDTERNKADFFAEFGLKRSLTDEELGTGDNVNMLPIGDRPSQGSTSRDRSPSSAADMAQQVLVKAQAMMAGLRAKAEAAARKRALRNKRNPRRVLVYDEGWSRSAVQKAWMVYRQMEKSRSNVDRTGQKRLDSSGKVAVRLAEIPLMRIRDIRAELKLRGLRTGGYHEEIMDRLTKAVEQEEFEWLNPPPPDAVSEMRLWLEGYLPDEKSYLAPPAVQIARMKAVAMEAFAICLECVMSLLFVRPPKPLFDEYDGLDSLPTHFFSSRTVLSSKELGTEDSGQTPAKARVGLAARVVRRFLWAESTAPKSRSGSSRRRVEHVSIEVFGENTKADSFQSKEDSHSETAQHRCRRSSSSGIESQVSNESLDSLTTSTKLSAERDDSWPMHRPRPCDPQTMHLHFNPAGYFVVFLFFSQNLTGLAFEMVVRGQGLVLYQVLAVIWLVCALTLVTGSLVLFLKTRNALIKFGFTPSKRKNPLLQVDPRVLRAGQWLGQPVRADVNQPSGGGLQGVNATVGHSWLERAPFVFRPFLGGPLLRPLAFPILVALFVAQGACITFLETGFQALALFVLIFLQAVLHVFWQPIAGRIKFTACKMKPYYCNTNMFRVFALVPILAVLGFAAVLDFLLLDTCEDLNAGLDFIFSALIVLGILFPGIICAWHVVARLRLSNLEITARVTKSLREQPAEDDDKEKGDLELDEEAMKRAEYEGTQKLLAEGYSKTAISKAMVLKHFDLNRAREWLDLFHPSKKKDYTPEYESSDEDSDEGAEEALREQRQKEEQLRRERQASRHRASKRAMKRVEKLDNKWTKRNSKLSKVLKMTGAMAFAGRHRRNNAGSGSALTQNAIAASQADGLGDRAESKEPASRALASPRKSQVVPFAPTTEQN